MMRLRQTVLLCLLAPLASCITTPSPHRAVLTPEVSGTLSTDDASPQQIPIKVCLATGDTCCIGAEAHGLVSAAGAFAIASTTELRGFTHVMAHKKFHWCIAIQKESKWHAAGPYSQYTLVDTGPAFPVRLDCRYGQGELTCRELPGHLNEDN